MFLSSDDSRACRRNKDASGHLRDLLRRWALLGVKRPEGLRAGIHLSPKGTERLRREVSKKYLAALGRSNGHSGGGTPGRARRGLSRSRVQGPRPADGAVWAAAQPTQSSPSHCSCPVQARGEEPVVIPVSPRDATRRLPSRAQKSASEAHSRPSMPRGRRVRGTHRKAEAGRPARARGAEWGALLGCRRAEHGRRGCAEAGPPVRGASTCPISRPFRTNDFPCTAETDREESLSRTRERQAPSPPRARRCNINHPSRLAETPMQRRCSIAVQQGACDAAVTQSSAARSIAQPLPIAPSSILTPGRSKRTVRSPHPQDMPEAVARAPPQAAWIASCRFRRKTPGREQRAMVTSNAPPSAPTGRAR